MLRHVLALFGSLALVGCMAPLGNALGDNGTATTDGATTTTAASSCNPVIGGTGGQGLATCGADEVCIFTNGSTFDATETGCYPIVNTGTSDGDACSTLDACGPGQACTNLGCQTLCWVGDACANGAACVADTSTNLAVNGSAVGYCPPQSSCSLVGDSSCTNGCTPYSDGHAQCRATAGASAQGGVCTSDDDCAAGLACDDATKECTTYCRVGGSDCTSGSCLTDGRAAVVVDGVTYGYCSL